jgi:splicing factor U2AF 65 kDa subunit
MTNMVTAAELNDDAEYFDIKEDVSTECSEYGKVLTVIIPRVKEGYPPSNEGLIFVEFQEAAMARTCAIALSGRKFDSRVVIVDYVSAFNEL